MPGANGGDAPDDRALDRLLRRRVPVKSGVPQGARRATPAAARETQQPQPAAIPKREPDALLPLCVRIPVAVQMLGFCRTKIYQLIKRGELETVEIDGSTRVTMRSLQAFVERHARVRGFR